MILYNSEFKAYYSSLINKDKVFGVFGTRLQGDARDNQTIKNFLVENDVDFQKLIDPEQVHSSNLIFYESDEEKDIVQIEETDGLLTSQKGVVLSVITADCPPIIFIDKTSGIVAISHQGWRGSLKRLPQKMVTSMKEKGVQSSSIKAAIGPSIGECCYEVSDDLYYEFLDEFEKIASSIFSSKKGRRHLNLTKLNYLLLLEAGLKKENIDFFPFCTHCNDRMFYSHRKMKSKRSDFPRQFSLIVKT